MENIGIGIQLMVVGMTTVFLILLIVIWGGKLLIMAVNKIAPEEVTTKKQSAVAASAATPATVDATTMQVLQAVVSQLTGGKGHVANAQRI